MASIAEIKKAAGVLAKKLEDSMAGLEKLKDAYDSQATKAEQVLRGSSTNVENEVVGKIRNASTVAGSARDALSKAVEVLTAYADAR